MESALVSAGVDREGELGRAGAVLGSAFGSVDACSAFVRRVYDKGPRFASPAVFPSLLPSSPIAHASIYHRLGGPVLASADLGATPEGAMVTAAELIAAGEADLMFAGGVAEASPIIEAVLGPLCSEGLSPIPRGEGTAVLLLGSADAFAGAAVAELAWWASWRGEPQDALAAMPPPLGRAALALSRDDGRALGIVAHSEVQRMHGLAVAMIAQCGRPLAHGQLHGLDVGRPGDLDLLVGRITRRSRLLVDACHGQASLVGERRGALEHVERGHSIEREDARKDCWPSRPRSTFLSTRRTGTSEESCGTKPVRARKARSSAGAMSATACPSIVTRPVLACSEAFMRRSRVVLPAPLGPTMARRSAGETLRLTPSRTCRPSSATPTSLRMMVVMKSSAHEVQPRGQLEDALEVLVLGDHQALGASHGVE